MVMGRQTRGGAGAGRGASNRSGKGKGNGRLTPSALASHTSAAATGAGGDEPAAKRHCRSRPLGCIACGQAPPAVTPVADAPDRCETCFQTYVMAFTMHGTWDEFVEVLKADEEVQSDFDEAKRVHAKTQEKEFFPTEITEDEQFMVDVQQAMLGPSRAQIIDALGVTPEDIGAKLQDLVDVNGLKYKGILIPDPFQPYPRFVVTNRVGLGKRQFSMPHDRQVYARQADASFSFLRDATINSGDRGMIVTKMRTSPWSMAGLMQKANDVRAQRGLGPAPGWPSLPTGVAAGASNAAGSEESAHKPLLQAAAGGSDDAKVAEPPSRPLITGPVLNSKARGLEGGSGRSKRLLGGASDAASVTSGVSPGKPRLRLDANGIPCSDEDRRELVKRRIESASIAQILVGTAMGREVSWAKHTMELYTNAGEVELSRELADHIVLCGHAEELATKSIANMEQHLFEHRVKELQAAGHDFPSSMKLSMWRRWLAQVNSIPDNAREWLLAILPWQVQDTANKIFDGLAPKLFAIESTPGEKGTLFSEAAKERLIEAIKKESSDVKGLAKFAGDIIEFLDAHCDDEKAEAFDENVSDVLTSAQALACVLDSKCTTHFQAGFALDDAGRAMRGSRPNVLYAVHCSLKANAYMWELFQDFCMHAKGTKEMLPELDKRHRMLTEDTLIADERLLQALQLLQKCVGRCRAGAYVNLETLADKALRQKVDAMNLNAEHWNDGSIDEKFASLRKLLDAAKLSLPSSELTWRSALHSVAMTEKVVQERRSLAGLKALAQQLEESDDMDEAIAKRVPQVLKAVVAHAVVLTPESSNDLQVVLQWVVSFVCETAPTPGVAESWNSLLSEVSTSSVCENSIGETVAKALRALGSWGPAVAVLHNLQKLGTSPEAIAVAPACDLEVRTLLAHLTHFGSAPEVVQKSQAMTTFEKEAKALVAGVGVCRVNMARSEMTLKHGAIQDTAKGGLAGESWVLELSEEKQKDPIALLQHAHQCLDSMDGELFAANLAALETAIACYKVLCDIYDPDGAKHLDCVTAMRTVKEARATKITGVMLHCEKENADKPVASKFRRTMKRLMAEAEQDPDVKAAMHPTLWAWVETAAGLVK